MKRIIASVLLALVTLGVPAVASAAQSPHWTKPMAGSSWAGEVIRL